MQKLIYKKGLILKVSSWENDGDHSRTIEYTPDTIEEGKALKRMCEDLFRSSNNDEGGIANDYGVSLESYEEMINEFFEKDEYFKGCPEEDRMEELEEIIDNLLGYSEEGYSCRLCESATLFEVKEDVYLDMVEL